VFVRNGTMYFLQRGKETNIYDISSLQHTEPNIVSTIFRSRFSPNNKQSSNTTTKEKHTKGFSGAVTWPDGSFIDYENGNPYFKHMNVNPNPHVGVSHEFADTWIYYDSENRAYHERMDAPDGSGSETWNYYYGKSAVETITDVWDKDGHHKVTKTNSVGGSNGSASVSSSTSESQDGSDDSELVMYNSANVSYGMIYSSDYRTDQQNISMSGSSVKWVDDDGNVVENIGAVSYNFPIFTKRKNDDGSINQEGQQGYQFARELMAEINSHDRCVQETVSLDIIMPVVNGVPKMTHIVDFTERVRLDGVIYYLVKNNVSQTTKKLVQSLELVRWYNG